MMEMKGKQILVDPFISPNELASHIDISSLKPDVILVTHGHADHVADLMTIAKQSNALVISTFEVASWVEQQGHSNMFQMNHGGKREFDFGTLKLVNAVHSSVLPDGSYGGNPCGFIIESEGKSIYLAGDTALTMDMKLIPMWTKLDLAVLPIGDNFTMGIEDAIIASDFIECNNILGMHFDTFGYIKINHEEAKTAFQAKGKELHLLEIEESISL